MKKAIALPFFTAAILAAGSASSAPVNLAFTGGTASGSVNIQSTPVGSTGSTPAYGFNMTNTDNLIDDFVAWCLDLSNTLAGNGVPAEYTPTNSPYSNSFGVNASQKARVQSVFDANYGSLDAGNNAQAAGFQTALWNALYDTDYSATAGAFSIAAGSAANWANTFLSNAMNFGGSKQYNVTYWESSGSRQRQNLVSAAVVPLPAGALLLFSALVGVGAVARKRRSA